MKEITIFYFFDVLCGWCFGFSPVIEQLHQEYGDTYNFKIISGGLKLGEEVGPIGVVAPYIKAGAYKQVEQRCNVKFGEDFICGPLEEGTLVLSSLNPAIAMSIVKTQNPNFAFQFGTLLHKALYVDGLDLEVFESYRKSVESLGMDYTTFVKDMTDPRYAVLAQEDFALSKSYGVSGFPAIIAIKGDSGVILSRGYTDYNTMAKRFEQINTYF